jgi:hypothetical protein
MKEIPLTQGKTALVDDADYGWLSEFKWRVGEGWNTYYALTNIYLPDGRRTTRRMHRIILGVGNSDPIDHINHNGLDNRRSNLRLVTTSQNLMNGRIRRDNTSGVRGVYFQKARKTWVAQIKVRGRHFCLGSFKDKNDAINAYRVAQLHHHGEFANL